MAASLVGVGLLALRPVYGSQLPSRSLIISNTAPSATAVYQLGFTIPQAETLATITLTMCSESPLPDAPCTPPTGMNMGAATLAAQTGATGFAITSSTGNSLVLSRAPGAVSVGTQLTFQLSGVANPSLIGSYYGRIQTFSSNVTTGTPTDTGGLAFAIDNTVQVSATVPPYLYFCIGLTISGTDCSTASGNYINFGNFSPAITSVGITQMVAATNADTGYTVTANGSTLTSGINTIPNLATADTSRPGTSQFGLNLAANQDPQIGNGPSGDGGGQPTAGYSRANFYKFVPGDVIVSVGQPDAPRAYTVSYITNVAKNQAPGVYAATMVFVASGQF